MYNYIRIYFLEILEHCLTSLCFLLLQLAKQNAQSSYLKYWPVSIKSTDRKERKCDCKANVGVGSHQPVQQLGFGFPKVSEMFVSIKISSSALALYAGSAKFMILGLTGLTTK